VAGRPHLGQWGAFNGDDGRQVRDEQLSRDAEEWIADMADDPERVWRSSWLAVCARPSRGERV